MASKNLSLAIFCRVMETELERAGLSHCTKVFVNEAFSSTLKPWKSISSM
jgi:hypothetical protein